MKALIVEIGFFEAFFKVHYTKTSRLTYPMPLPTTVAGMFGSMLGFSRKKAREAFAECLFGSGILGEVKRCVETATCIYATHRRVGAETTHILSEPCYYIVVADEHGKVVRWREEIEKGLEFLPFGGQNDFFPKYWHVIDVVDVERSTEIMNYLPASWVSEILPNTKIETFPVMHRLSDDNNFIFILEGAVKTNREMPVARINGKIIALYELNGFYQIGEWK